MSVFSKCFNLLPKHYLAHCPTFCMVPDTSPCHLSCCKNNYPILSIWPLAPSVGLHLIFLNVMQWHSHLFLPNSFVLELQHVFDEAWIWFHCHLTVQLVSQTDLSATLVPQCPILGEMGGGLGYSCKSKCSCPSNTLWNIVIKKEKKAVRSSIPSWFLCLLIVDILNAPSFIICPASENSRSWNQVCNLFSINAVSCVISILSRFAAYCTLCTHWPTCHGFHILSRHGIWSYKNHVVIRQPLI